MATELNANKESLYSDFQSQLEQYRRQSYEAQLAAQTAASTRQQELNSALASRGLASSGVAMGAEAQNQLALSQELNSQLMQNTQMESGLYQNLQSNIAAKETAYSQDMQDIYNTIIASGKTDTASIRQIAGSLASLKGYTLSEDELSKFDSAKNLTATEGALSGIQGLSINTEWFGNNAKVTYTDVTGETKELTLALGDKTTKPATAGELLPAEWGVQADWKLGSKNTNYIVTGTKNLAAQLFNETGYSYFDLTGSGNVKIVPLMRTGNVIEYVVYQYIPGKEVKTYPFNNISEAISKADAVS